MRHQRLVVLAAAVLCIGPVLAQRPKPHVPCETTPPPAGAAPADMPLAPGMTPPSPYYPAPPQQYSSDPTERMMQLLNESEDLRQAREEFHRFWMNNQPSTLTYERPCCTTGAREQFVVKSYAVGDLVVPPPTAGEPAPTEKPKTLERELIQKITANVAPKSWNSAGGAGTIEYFPLGLALVVNQTPDVHEALERYLDASRKFNDLQVVSEMVVITLSDAWFEKAGLAKAFAAKPGAKEDEVRALAVRPEAVRKLIQAAKEDGGIQMLSAPKITTLTGQPGRLHVGETQHYVTGVTVKAIDGNVVYIPKNESHDLGIDLTVNPEVSADGRSVKVAISGGVKELGVRPVRLIPISTQIQPVSTDGKPGEPVPFTQYIQEPKVVSRTVTGTVSVPDGGTTLLYGGKTTIKETTKEAIPFAADVPVLQALFTRDKTETSTNHLLVVLTTHVVRPEACCEACGACPKCDGKLARLLGDYGRACKEGKVEDARRLAIECLAIDPTCFGKK